MDQTATVAHEGSSFVRHIPCPDCGSRDNRGLFTDGHEFCFGCQAYKPVDGEGAATTAVKRKPLDLLNDLVIEALPKRGINEATCQHFGYGKSQYNGKTCQVAPYFDADGKPVAQKLRFAGKKFKVLGSLDTALPFGANRFQKTGKQIVVTEGEIDCLSMSQVQGNKWPVVSIPNGAQSAAKFIARHRDYFMGFEKVVLMFDMDDPGRTAAEAAAAVLGRRACIAELPLKDVNEMLLAGRERELIDAMWRAQPFRPEGIIEMSSLKEQAKTPPEVGLSYPWEELTSILYGIRIGQVIGLGAGVGSGKTDFYTQIAAHLVKVHGQSVGMFYLETPVVEIARRVTGKTVGQAFCDPEGSWTPEEFDAAWDGITNGPGRVFLYDSFGNNEWGPIKEKIEYLYHAEGVQFFFIDHLTALAAWQEDERKALEKIMSDIGGLVKAIPITIFFVSHLATPEKGPPHEEGGRVTGRHFKGSRSIIQWSTDLLGLERNQQAEDEEERNTSLVRCLKERTTGKGTGKTFPLRYIRSTGMLVVPDGTIDLSRDGVLVGEGDESKDF